MTARESLCEEVVLLLKGPYLAASADVLRGVVDRYRIQAKSTKHGKVQQTAREAIIQEIVAVWCKEIQDPRNEIMAIIDTYRMQHKQFADKAAKEASKAMQSQMDKSLSKKASLQDRVDLKKTKQVLQEAAFQPQAVSFEPVGGGPVKRKSARGQCPKCHSMGVVLARSYTGDEYFSCIYCGFQSFRSGIDADLDLPLAAELLQRKFDDNDQEEG